MNLNKSKTNFFIDVLMFLVMIMIAGIGILIKWVLISGKQRWKVYNENVDLTFLGLDRHQWGMIHLILGGLFFVLLVVHIVLHWKTIKCLLGRFFSGRYTKRVVSVAFAILCIILLFFPFLIHVDVETISAGKERMALASRTDRQDVTKETAIDLKTGEDQSHQKHHIDYTDIEIKGYMTLSKVSADYHIPLDILKTKLDLPASVSGNSRLGHLKKKYHFTMHEIEDIIHHYKNQ